MSEIINEMKISFPSKSINEGFARTACAAFAMLADPTINDMADIKTAISEAVTNCIVHAYALSEGIIYINAYLYDNGKLVYKIKDKGVGIENIKQAMEPMFTTAGGERAGLGFAVMQSFCDKLAVKSALGKGTTVTLEKNIIRYGACND